MVTYLLRINRHSFHRDLTVTYWPPTLNGAPSPRSILTKPFADRSAKSACPITFLSVKGCRLGYRFAKML